MAGIRVKASSLIEVIVALMILVLASTLASAFIVSNYKKTSTSYKIQAFLLLDTEVKNTLINNNYESIKYEKESFIIRKETSVNDKHLVTIYFSIEDINNNLIFERRRILMIDDTTAKQFNKQTESIYYP